MKPNRTRLKTRLAVRHVRSVRSGLRALVSIDQILDAWFATHDPIDSTEGNTPRAISTQIARDWAKVHINIKDKEVLYNALGRIYADSWVLGEDITDYELARALGVRKAAPNPKQLRRAIGINWSTWKPGNRAAARLVAPPNGLKRLLDARGLKLEGITRTTLDRIGTSLAMGLKQGLSRRDMAREINDILDDPERSLMIAGTESANAVVQASRELYRDSGVEMVEWLVADPCDDCQENYDQSPIPIDEEWRNGDPPVHPNCMCDIAPYVVDTVQWAEVYGEDAE
jgi:hypothetical protein